MEYLQTSDGRQLWQELTGTTLEGETISEIEQAVLRTNYESVPAEAVQKLEKTTREYGEARVLEEFSSSGFDSVEGITNPTKVTIVRNPDVLAKKNHRFEAIKTVSAR
jgi:hypothetical protein